MAWFENYVQYINVLYILTSAQIFRRFYLRIFINT